MIENSVIKVLSRSLLIALYYKENNCKKIAAETRVGLPHKVRKIIRFK